MFLFVSCFFKEIILALDLEWYFGSVLRLKIDFGGKLSFIKSS